MTEPYPDDVRAFAGEDLGQGAAAPNTPADPEATARQGGPRTGLVVAAPHTPDPATRERIVQEEQPDQRGPDSGQPAEVLQGYVVDLACLRHYGAEEYLERARRHTTQCALMGHCVESGYGLVGDDNRLIALDTGATPHVVAALQNASDRAARVRAERAHAGGGIQTTSVALL